MITVGTAVLAYLGADQYTEHHLSSDRSRMDHIVRHRLPGLIDYLKALARMADQDPHMHRETRSKVQGQSHKAGLCH